jgi:hypothetical protein
MVEGEMLEGETLEGEMVEGETLEGEMVEGETLDDRQTLTERVRAEGGESKAALRETL